MNTKAVDFYARWRKGDAIFAAFNFAFFVYAVLVWGGLVGDGSAWRPGQTVLLSAALLTQTLASLIQGKSRTAFYVMLAGSMVFLCFAMFPR